MAAGDDQGAAIGLIDIGDGREEIDRQGASGVKGNILILMQGLRYTAV